MKICTNNEQLKEDLTEFAIRVNREVGVRMGMFSPDTPTEKRQLSEGMVKVPVLDVVRDYLLKHGG